MRLLEWLLGLVPRFPLAPMPDRSRAWGKGTGRPSYAVVQRRRAANKRARAARRVTRRRSR